jgi:hypothetical protein
MSYNFVSQVRESPAGRGGAGAGLRVMSQEQVAENRDRAERRAKQEVRRRVMAGGLEYLLSCTYRSVQRDRRKVIEDWRAFVRLVRRRYPDWAYVQVLEYQARGSLHHHAAVRGFQNVAYLRQCWWEVTGGDGNIDVQAPRGKRGPASMARYLVKYLSKGFAQEAVHEPGQHRYLTSQGLNPVLIRFELAPGDSRDVLEAALTRFEALYGPLDPHNSRVWSEDGWLRGWMCNWV